MGFHALIIGAGSTGAALAHDLTLRGYRVTVVERGEVASETTGRNHGLFHSGGRYAMRDPEAARECAEDNAIVRRIMPGLLELNGGLFVAFNEEDLSYKDRFLEACANCGVPAQEIDVQEALRMEPNLNPNILAAVKVNDGVFDPFHFALAFLATAKSNGAKVYTYTEVLDFTWEGRTVTGVHVRDRRSGKEYELGADFVINAAGPWAGRIAAMAGLHLSVVPTAGVMVAVARRWTRHVINRLNMPGDGDIIVPQRRASVIGTTSWRVEDPDFIPIPDHDFQLMLRRAQEMVPDFNQAPVRGVSAAARPLVKTGGVVAGNERWLSRGTYTFNHARDGVEGLFSIVGGKTTTARFMAEQMANFIGEAVGVDVPCRTKEVELLPYHAYYRLGGER